MVEREHATGRNRADGVPDATSSSDVRINVRSAPSASADHEAEAEAERQLKIGRAVQHDFKEVLAVLAK